ncbi:MULTISPECIES: DJ-1 family glyoxalase III [unclassified Guyparkeria]|uniref:DJ-1 family glyoxalase III n=1 Tax=unclassified Guyparkeria TaxID=2626246 RepID=UPI000733A0D9|nr:MULTISPECIES: DJ-1 family glyoxalase III [unclassified Guyparkeria]KTG16687.1 4-methyl-5(B-hydroxyethyl)-thiazole monophosphate biosynthesis protein [Guyparkeria sp. XI15]OAE85721.1 4-methyl-5(B-hydroxyethyl)-thiazole monophosphate biosynthesis protein [Guyparkeria sp. WRN-7]
MASKAMIVLAPGFEDLEAITTIDILRRAGVQVHTLSLREHEASGSRGVTVVTDSNLGLVDETSTYDAIVLPGGQPGANNLAADQRLLKRLQDQSAAGRWIAAICAAPKVLAAAGVLKGHRITHFPGALTEEESRGVEICDEAVVVDGNLVTGRGPGVALDFALALVEQLEGRETRDEVEAKLAR